MLLAIYIEPPADVRSVPQNYTVHCITTSTGLQNKRDNVHVVSLELLGRNLGVFQSTLNDATFTYDYSEEVVWRAEKVIMQSTEFSDQGLTKYNGDHDWACKVDTNGHNYDLQTYIKG